MSCVRKTQKKYVLRDSPAYPANECCGMIKIGNDGHQYISKRAVTGICRWVPLVRTASEKPKAKKSISKKTTSKKTIAKKSKSTSRKHVKKAKSVSKKKASSSKKSKSKQRKQK